MTETIATVTPVPTRPVGRRLTSWLRSLTLLPGTSTLGQPPDFRAGGAVHQLPVGSVALILPMVTDENSEHAELWQARAALPVRIPEGYFIVPGPHHGPETATFQAFSKLNDDPRPLPAGLATQVLAQWHD